MLKKYIEILEFDKILKLISEQAIYDESKNEILALEPTNDLNKINTQLKTIESAQILFLRFNSPDMLPCNDISFILKKIERGGIASLKELLCILQLLKTVENIKVWRESCHEEKNELDAYIENLEENSGLRKKIEDAVISEEELSDSASSLLKNIRNKIKNASIRIKEKISIFAKSPETQEYIREDIIAIKDGRFVIPVKSEYKNKIKGFVHSTSTSGSTLFVEPECTILSNNKLRILEAEEKEEVYKILREFSTKILENMEILKNNFKMIVLLDVIFAKARFSIKIDAVIPEVNDCGKINFISARHPLLPKEKVVPIDISIGEEFSTLVITGSNMGGKTVTLKTIGLFVLMAMSGLPLPLNEGSCVSVFDNVLADIGDEQSIEQNLSTFSGHIINLVSMINTANSKSLVLTDELGSGTDPVEGAGLAISILNELKNKGAKVVATTHYAELKMYAINTKGVQNASCEFDIRTLRPTYKLNLGIPGKSNAFEIAKKLGLEQRIIDDAVKNIDKSSLMFESVICELNEQKQKMQNQIKQNEELKAQLMDEHKKLEAMQEKIYEKEEELVREFRGETEPIIASLKNKLKNVSLELEQIKKEKDIENLEQLRNKLKSDLQVNLGKIYSKYQKESKKQENHLLAKGSNVFVISFNKNGILVTNPDSKGFASVRMGNILIKVHINDLKLHTEKVTERIKIEGYNSSAKVFRKTNTELHLRGLNSEEAIDKLDKFIDDAVISGLHTVTVIHGKGTGILKRAVHDYLNSINNIKSFRLGRYGEGEDGVTIVEL